MKIETIEVLFGAYQLGIITKEEVREHLGLPAKPEEEN